MSRILRVVSVQSVLQHLDLPLVAILRIRPPNCHHEEGNALRARQIRLGEGENATGLPGVYRRRCRCSCVVHARFWDEMTKSASPSS